MNFKETEYNLTNFSPKTVTHQKVQQVKSINLFYCIHDFYKKQKMDNRICPRKIESISEEIYKRTVIPFYILILSLISSSLLIKPKSNKYLKYYKFFVFFIGFIFILISQIGSKFLTQNLINDFFVLSAPIIFVAIFYLSILLKTKFKLKHL
jgi:Predicted permeases